MTKRKKTLRCSWKVFHTSGSSSWSWECYVQLRPTEGGVEEGDVKCLCRKKRFRTVFSQNKPHSALNSPYLSFYYFLPQLIAGHLYDICPQMELNAWCRPLAHSTLQQKPCDCLHLHLTQDKDTWIVAWVMKKRVFWSVLCQSQFVFSLPPPGHGPMFHCSLLSLPLKASVGACCWRCLWGCPVPTGSRPPCCPPPRESCGPGSEVPAGEPSSQSRSSTLWPSPRHRARIGESCPRPAMEKPVRRVSLGVWAIQHRSYWRDDIINLQPGRQVCLEAMETEWVSVCLTSCVLKKCDCSRTDRSSSSRCR